MNGYGGCALGLRLKWCFGPVVGVPFIRFGFVYYSFRLMMMQKINRKRQNNGVLFAVDFDQLIIKGSAAEVSMLSLSYFQLATRRNNAR